MTGRRGTLQRHGSADELSRSNRQRVDGWKRGGRVTGAAQQRAGLFDPAAHVLFVALAEGDVAIDLPVIEILRDTCLARTVGEDNVFVPPACVLVGQLPGSRRRGRDRCSGRLAPRAHRGHSGSVSRDTGRSSRNIRLRQSRRDSSSRTAPGAIERRRGATIGRSSATSSRRVAARMKLSTSATK